MSFRDMLSLISGALLFPLIAHAGHDNGHGGDSDVAEFRAVAMEVLQIVRSHPEAFAIKSSAFEAIVKQAKVESTSQRLTSIPEFLEVDAINFPEKQLIRFNRDRWFSTWRRPEKRRLLVAHEYFRLLGLKDLNYQISGQLLSMPGRKLFSFDCDVLKHINRIYNSDYRLIGNIFVDGFDYRIVNSTGKELPQYQVFETRWDDRESSRRKSVITIRYNLNPPDVVSIPLIPGNQRAEILMTVINEEDRLVAHASEGICRVEMY